jgi:hypothetical protein
MEMGKKTEVTLYIFTRPVKINEVLVKKSEVVRVRSGEHHYFSAHWLFEADSLARAPIGVKHVQGHETHVS